MEDTKVEKIPFTTTRIPDSAKPVGEEIVVQDGVDGTHTVVTIDGHVTSDRTIAPKSAVLYYGTLEVEDSTPDAETETQTQEVEVDTNPPLAPEVAVFNQPQVSLISNKEILGMNLESLKQAALEAARLLVFAIPGILITVFTNNPELGGSLGATILLVLKSFDRAIHENKDTPVKGLLPF